MKEDVFRHAPDRVVVSKDSVSIWGGDSADLGGSVTITSLGTGYTVRFNGVPVGDFPTKEQAVKMAIRLKGVEDAPE
jgi:hypothetical protein